MKNFTLMEELHLKIFAPSALGADAHDAMYRTLNRRRFRAQVRSAMRAVIRQYRSLRKARLAVTR